MPLHVPKAAKKVNQKQFPDLKKKLTDARRQFN